MEVGSTSTASSSTASAWSGFRSASLQGAARAAIFLAPAMLLYAAFVLVPLCQLAWIALQQWNGFGPMRFVGTRNLETLWSDPAFRDALDHSLTWMVGAIALTAVGAALGIAAWRARWGNASLAALLFPALLPQIVLAAIWLLAYSPLAGLVTTVLTAAGLGRFTGAWLGDTRLAPGALFVAWAWSAVGVSAVICRSALAGIGREYFELAAVEGAGVWWRLWHIALPGIRQSIALAVLVNVALAAQVFDLIYATTGGGPGDATMTLPLDMYARAFGGQTGEGAAAAMIQVAGGIAVAALALLAVRGSGGMNSGEEARTELSGYHLVPTLAMPLVAGVMLLPLSWLIGVALGIAGTTIGPAATWDPRTWNLGSFGSVWSAGMGSAVVMSLLLALSVTVAVLALALPAAFALVRVRSGLLRAALLAVLTVGLFQPMSVLVIPLFSLLGDFGLLDTAWGVALPEIARALPAAVLIIWAWFTNLPCDVRDAAEVDGAGWSRQLVSVAAPLSLPALFAAGAWAFLTSWNEYLLPTVVSQDGSLTTVPTLLGTFVGRADTEYAALAAGCLLAIVPVLLLYLVLHRSVRLFANGRRGLA